MKTVSYKKLFLTIFLVMLSTISTLSYAEVDNSFLMNEIALRSAKSGLSGSGLTGSSGARSNKSSIVDFLKSSNESFEKATNLQDKTEEGFVKRSDVRDLSGSSKSSSEKVSTSRIDQIATTGKYRKKFDANVALKNTQKKQTTKKIKTSSIRSPESDISPQSLAPKLLDKKPPKKSSKKKGKKVRYCLGGSFKALARKAKKYDVAITKYSKKYGVPKALIKAVITAESCFNPKALSPKGAQGLMQLMPATAKRFGVTARYNPDLNIKAGTNYLKFLTKYFKKDMIKVIAAYNAGEGAVNKYKGVPPYKETKNYVRKVATLYTLYSNGHGVITAEAFSKSLLKMNLPTTPEEIRRIIFVPQAMPSSRFSPYKNRLRNIARGNCANRTSTRLKQSTEVEGGDGIWQRIYNASAGETLTQVMRKTGVHKLKIAQMNGIRPRTKLKMGQRLLVWECRK
jgi:hypothetical protein